MADTKLRVTMYSGRVLKVIVEGVGPAAIKSAIETAKADGKMLQVRGRLLAPEYIESVEVR